MSRGRQVLEIVVRPRADVDGADSGDHEAWLAYASDLRDLLVVALAATGTRRLEVGDLVVTEPLPDKYAGIRNGTTMGPDDAVELAVEMAGGRSPFCALVDRERFRLDNGWDGAVHLFLDAGPAGAIAARAGDGIVLSSRTGRPEPDDVVDPALRPVDDEFWSAVRALTGDVVLLHEEWAHGRCGSSWFRVTPDDLDTAARVVRPRSVLSVTVDPFSAPGPDLTEEGFVAFRTPMSPGPLTYRAFPFGVDDVDGLVRGGYSFVVRDSAPAALRAVVPDVDGAVGQVDG